MEKGPDHHLDVGLVLFIPEITERIKLVEIRIPGCPRNGLSRRLGERERVRQGNPVYFNFN